MVEFFSLSVREVFELDENELAFVGTTPNAFPQCPLPVTLMLNQTHVADLELLGERSPRHLPQGYRVVYCRGTVAEIDRSLPMTRYRLVSNTRHFP